MKKQVIVMRNDLNMRKGKMVAQGAHAAMKVLLDEGSVSRGMGGLSGREPISFSIDDLSEHFLGWIDGAFTKVCVRCDSEDELVELYNQAKDAKLPCSLIEDNGATEFNGVKTKTCIAIGPAEAELIDTITGHLKLL